MQKKNNNNGIILTIYMQFIPKYNSNYQGGMSTKRLSKELIS